MPEEEPIISPPVRRPRKSKETSETTPPSVSSATLAIEGSTPLVERVKEVRAKKGEIRRPVNQCTAHSRTRNGERCRLPVIPGKNVCYYHGGMTPSGVASGKMTHGGRSKFKDIVPVRYQNALDAALNDPELLSLREDVAMIEIRQREVFSRLNTGEAGSLWRRLQQVNAQLNTALQNRDIPLLQSSLRELTDLTQRGAEEGTIWQEYLSLTTQKAKIVASERRAEEAKNTSMKVDMLSYIFARIDYSIRTNVKNDMERAAIGVDLRALVYEIRSREMQK